MRFRAGLVIGFATGFYVGTMAGRERYEQINRTLRRAKRSEAFDVAADKAKAVVDLGVERARDMVETKFSRDSGIIDVSTPIGNGPVAHTPSQAGSAEEAPHPGTATSSVPSKAGNGDRPH
jgi:hypothetical protein